MSFPRYPKYKDSGVEWLGEIPECWTIINLKRLGNIQYGIGEPPKYQLEGTPLIRATNVHAGRLFDEGMVYVDPSDIPQQRIVWLNAGDIIVVRSGAYTGDSAIIPRNYAACIAGFDMVLKLHAANPEFIQYALLSNYLKERQIDLEKMRAAQPHLNAEELGSCIVVLPSRAEQTAIAAFLEREAAKIDALVAEQRRLMELLAEKRQAVISHAVTKGLDPHAKLKPSGIEWLGDVPEHWSVAAVRFRYTVQLGKMLDTEKITGKHLKPYLRVFDVQWGAINIDDLPQMDFDPAARERFVLAKNDLLINEGGSYPGRSAIWQGELEECYFQKALHRLRPCDPATDTTRFFYYIMAWATSFGVFTAGGNESTIEHLPAEKFRKYRFPFPPIEEQIKISDFLDLELGRFDTLTTEAQRAIELLQERRTALISAAVTGKIDVRGIQENAGSVPCETLSA